MPAIQLSSSYTQDFDTLASSGTNIPWADDSTIAGWYSTRTTYNAGTGSSTTGALYSFGTSSDRALGSLASGGTGTIYYGVQLVNNTANPINALTIGYSGEQWRNGGSSSATPGVAQTLNFQYQIGATGLTTGTWIDFNPLDFTTPVFGTTTSAALDGNAATNRVALSATLGGLTLAAGQEIWLRWEDVNDANNDHGVAIDGFTLSAGNTPTAGVTITQSGGSTEVNEQGETTDSYAIALNTTPTGTVNITVNADAETVISVDGVNFFSTLNLSFTSTTSQTITVRAVNDTDVEGSPHLGTITHTITSSTDPAYSSTLTPIPNLSVNVLDNDVALQITKIHQIQGNASTQLSGGAHNDVSSLNGQTVTIEGIVTADFQAGNQLRGFFIQEESADQDADATTSEGIFVFTGNTAPLDVQEGQKVRVTGSVSEFFGMTQVSATAANSISLITPGNNLAQAPPTLINLPATGNIDDYYEQFEGMRVQFADTLYVSEYFELARYGQIVLTEGGRPFQYSHTDNTPTQAEYATFLDNLERSRIILDDDDNTQNSPLPNGTFFYPQPGGFGTGTQGSNFFRGGDSVSNLTGVLHWSFAGQSGTDAWRIRPTQETPVSFTVENPRPTTPPNPGGNIKVASFNVLNYFTTIDTVGGNGSPRGADSVDEFNRQNEKLVDALANINADVFGLVEIENNGGIALQELVNRLNARVGSGTYAYIDTGVVGTDQITVGMIYKPAVVQPKGEEAILLDPGFTNPNGAPFQRNRPAIAQTFEVIDANNPDFGAAFNVVVNHLKSKGGSDATGADVDQNDGQGQFNDTRAKAADYLVNTWLPTDPTGQGDPDYLIIGDLNAYKGENPITTIKNAGYTDLVEAYGGNSAYSYVFDGQLGYLDHALANASLAAQVTGVVDWHINADEVPVFDYNNTIDDGGGESSFEAKPTGNNLYEPNAFRTSDHDPVIIGLDLTRALSTVNIAASGNPTEANTVPGLFTISRSGTNTIGNLLVNFTIAGSAGFGTDYTVTGANFSNGTVTIPDGQSSVTVTVTPINDAIAEPAETVQLALTATSNYTLGNNSAASLTISDNDFNVIDGTNRPDSIQGTNLNDRIAGGNGEDTLDGDAGDDDLNGGNGDDIIFGGLGRDTLNGENGSDRLDGGIGQDTLTGGNGADVFAYKAIEDLDDTITDFSVSSDRIDVSLLLASVGYSGTNPFAEGYLGSIQQGSNTLVQFDANGGGDTFVTLATLQGVTTPLSLSSFITA